MTAGADHRPCVGHPSIERLFVHIATLADGSGKLRSIPDVDRGARVTSAVMAEDMSENRIQAHVVSTAIALIVLILLWGYSPVMAMLCASLLFVFGYLIAKSL
jgi:hypothetical protein